MALISVVVPCYNEAEVFPVLRAELCRLGERLSPRHELELVLVDDGSTDSTWAEIRAFAAADPRVRGFALSRNFGHQLALSCGYEVARGDAVVCLDADLQDPPEVVPKLIEQWQQGADIVYAVRTRRAGESWLKRLTAAAFYRTLRLLGSKSVRVDTGDFRLMSRKSLEALRSMPEHHRFIRGMVGWLGFHTADVPYERRPRRAGVTKYTWRTMVRFAVDATVSFSTSPLRLAFVLALLLGAGVLGYLGYTALRYFAHGVEVVPGWTSLLLAIMAFGTVNLVCLGILGEYVGRIYEQAKNRPLYLVREHTDEVRQRAVSRLPGL